MNAPVRQPCWVVSYGIILAVTGVDPFTGHHLSDRERRLAIVPATGEMIGAFARTGTVVLSW